MIHPRMSCCFIFVQDNQGNNIHTKSSIINNKNRNRKLTHRMHEDSADSS